MRMINTRAHAIVDYALALVLLAAPLMFGFSGSGTAYAWCMIAAAIIIISALMSRFELSLIKLIPLRVHLWIDMLTGILLAISPLIWNFSDKVFKPHLVFGLTLFIVALLTDRIPHEKIKNKIKS